MQNKSIHFNNIVLMVLFIFWGLINILTIEGNYFITGKTIFLSNILCVEIYFILIIGKLKKNPYLSVLGFILTFFYLLRIVTLTFLPPNRFVVWHNLSATDYNYALQVIIVLALIISLLAYNIDRIGVNCKNKNVYLSKKRGISGLIYIFTCSLLLSIIAKLFPSGVIHSFASYGSQIIPLNIVVFFTIICFIGNKSTLKRREKYVFLFILLLYVIYYVFCGNKSAIFNLVILYILAGFAINKTLRIKFNDVFSIVVILTLCFYLYPVANKIRDEIWKGDRNISLIGSVVCSIDKEYFIDYGTYIASHIAGRIGFLDHATRIIKKSQEYQDIFTLNNYIKSFVDYTSPGMNIFNAVRVSNSIVSFDMYGSIPTMDDYLQESYCSNNVTVFGEMYSLGRGLIGAVLIIIIFFLVMFSLFNYFAVNSKTLFEYYSIKALQLSFFYSIINSFGLDWGLSRLFFTFVFYFLFKRFYHVYSANEHNQLTASSQPNKILHID